MLESNSLRIQTIFDPFLLLLCPNICLLLLVCLRRRRHIFIWDCVYLHCIALLEMQRMQAARSVYLEANRCEKCIWLYCKCDQELAKNAIYRSSISVHFCTFGWTAFKPIYKTHQVSKTTFTLSSTPKAWKRKSLESSPASFDLNPDPVSQFPSFGERLNFVLGLVLDSAIAALLVKCGFMRLLRLHKHIHLSVIWALELKEQKYW